MGNMGFNELLLVFFAFIFIVPAIFFLITQQNTLKAIQVQNRTISPGQVWLQLIPLFGVVWQFIVVSRIADSIQKELAADHSFSFEQPQAAPVYDSGPKPTYSIGLAYCILFCCSIIPLLGTLASLAGLVCWIIYWVKLSEYKSKLQLKSYAAGF